MEHKVGKYYTTTTVQKNREIFMEVKMAYIFLGNGAERTYCSPYLG